MARVAIMVFGVGGANTGTGHNQDVLNFMKNSKILIYLARGTRH
jgi:hypothetical protein